MKFVMSGAMVWHWSILEMVRYVEVPRTWKLIERPSSRLLDVLYGRCEYNDSVLATCAASFEIGLPRQAALVDKIMSEVVT